MLSDGLWLSWSDAGRIALSAPLMVVSVIAVIRLIGLRSFSKMSSFDFAVTVAIGSVMASVVASTTSVAGGVLATLALLASQTVVAWLRRATTLESVVDNSPMLLMRGTQIDDAALDACRVTRSDVIAKLREANVLQMSEVRAVVMEATGDISVLHGDVDIDDELLEGVRRSTNRRLDA